MKASTSRRSFLEQLTFAASGVALMSSTSVIHAFTKNENAFKGYNPYADTNSDLRQTIFRKHIKVSGKVYCKISMKPLANAMVEVWHLSPNSIKYRHRAKLKTNAEGYYSFITDLPNKEKGNMPCINFKLSDKNQSYCSRLWIHEKAAFISSDHWTRNEQLDDLLLPKKESHLTCDTINFNLSI